MLQQAEKSWFSSWSTVNFLARRKVHIGTKEALISQLRGHFVNFECVHLFHHEFSTRKHVVSLHPSSCLVVHCPQNRPTLKCKEGSQLLPRLPQMTSSAARMSQEWKKLCSLPPLIVGLRCHSVHTKNSWTSNKSARWNIKTRFCDRCHGLIKSTYTSNKTSPTSQPMRGKRGTCSCRWTVIGRPLHGHTYLHQWRTRSVPNKNMNVLGITPSSQNKNLFLSPTRKTPGDNVYSIMKFAKTASNLKSQAQPR